MNPKIAFLQFLLLGWKNILLLIRRPIGILVEYSIPIFGSLVLVILRFATAPEESTCFATFQPDGIQLSATVNAALVASGTSLFCNFTYFYTPSNNQTDAIIATAMGILGNQFTTVEFIPSGSEAELGAMTSERIRAYDLLADSDSPANCATLLQAVGIFRPVVAGLVFNELEPNIDVAIRLDPNELDSEVTPPTPVVETVEANNYITSGFISLQDAITQSIIQQMISNLTSSYTSSLLPIDAKRFPYFPATFSEYLYEQSVLIPVVLIFIYLYSANKLRESMLIMGLSKGVNWLSWYIKNLIFLAPVVLICTIILKFGGVFQFSNFLILYILFMLHINTLITLSFIIGGVFSSSRVAIIVVMSVYFANFIPYFFIQNYFYSLPLYAFMLLSLFNNSGYSIAIVLLSEFEQKQIGLQWYNINSPVNNFADVTVLQVFLMLLFDSIIYFAFAWYLDEVLPKEYGYQRPFYFPFTSYYWCGRTVKCSRPDPNLGFIPVDRNSKSDAFENDPHDIDVGLKIEGLTKHFGKKKVLRSLSLNMYKGQITSLLGHNGAGKSTTISIITGLYPPTSGTAYVAGYDIKKDPEHVRESLGICPQHNVLFDLLTVWEHLHFFIRLKGIWNWNRAIKEVNQTMLDINLVEKKQVFSSNLSGGMKRRLSVGLAFIGGSKTVILDEPTSGLDPEARRTLWDMLERSKINRTILLTTHFMEEADVLGDRIAIMARGGLKACGSSLFLKTRFGVGYHLNMSLKTEEENSVQIANRVFDVVKHYVPDGNLEDYISNYISFILPLDQPMKFVKLFQFLEESGQIIGVESFGCSLTTLEEVFSEVSSIKFEERVKNKTDRKKSFIKQKTMMEQCSVDAVDITIDTEEPLDRPKEDGLFFKQEIEVPDQIRSEELHTTARSLFQTRKCQKSVSSEGEHETMQQIMSEISKSKLTIHENESIKELSEDPFKQNLPRKSSEDNSKEKKNRGGFRKGSKIKSIFLRDKPRLASVLEDIELDDKAPTHQELKLEHIEDLYSSLSLNSGITLRLQQIWGMFVKKFLYSIRRYYFVILQLLVPFLLITTGLLTNYIISTTTTTDDLLLSVGNTFTRPDQASVFYMETPETVNAFQNSFTLSYLSSFAQSKGDFLTTSYLSDYLSILNSVPTNTNATQCCNYQYQILDEYCAHLLQSDFNAINNCASLNSAFGYTNCPTCLSCTTSSSISTCPRPPGVVYDPTNPGTFSDSYRGALPVREIFIEENVLRLGSPNRIDYVETFFAGFTTSQEVPYFQSGECLCCSESVTFTDMNESSGVCSDAFTPPSTCNSIGVGRAYQNISNYPSRVTLWYSNEIDELAAVGLANLHDYQLTHLWQTYNLSGKPPTISMHNHPLANEVTNVDLIETRTEALTIALFIGFAVSFIGGSLVVFTVEEREIRSKYLQHVSGLHTTSYWIGSLLWDSLFSVVSLMIMFIPFTLFPDTPFTGTNLLLVWLLLLSYNVCTLPLAYLVSFLFENALVAFGSLTVIHFLSVVLGILLSHSINDVSSSVSAAFQYVFAISPSFSVGNGVYNIYVNTRHLTFCNTYPQTLDLCRNNNIDVEESLFTFDTPGVLLFIVLPAIIGIVSFILTMLIDKFHFNQLILRSKQQNNSESKTENIDDDVLEEKERIKHEKYKNDVIVIKNLTKIFTNGVFKKTSKLAVNDLSIGLQRGECFGLLGVNGAGKTTTFEMLTGNLAATSGSMRVERFDVRTQLSYVRQRIGYCPQFDALQGYLNSHQLLTLYARIRGVPEKFIKKAVLTEIERMHLQVHAKYPSQTYSGGNRRKLSTAAALIGGAPVILLDEPTTGMDPDSRREFWNVVAAMTKAGRTIVLTTHSMEECEALCTRLTIMVNGEFQCLGNVQHLKTKFGDGYTINLQAKELETPEANTRNINDIKEYISSVFDASILTSEHALALDYHISSKNQHYSEIFERMENFKEKLNIASYGVSQTTLEQVFLRFAKHQIYYDNKS